MKTKTTFENVLTFALTAQVWLAQNKDNENTKLGYAISRMNARIQKAQQRYNNQREDIQIDCCQTDEKGIILKDEQGQYKFTKPELKRRNKEWQDLFEKEIEIEPYFATALPDDLTYVEREAFAGFVISPERVFPEDEDKQLTATA